jgi:hypothetical protein
VLGVKDTNTDPATPPAPTVTLVGAASREVARVADEKAVVAETYPAVDDTAVI